MTRGKSTNDKEQRERYRTSLYSLVSHASTQHHMWCVQFVLNRVVIPLRRQPDTKHPPQRTRANTNPLFTKVSDTIFKIDGCLVGGVGDVR